MASKVRVHVRVKPENRGRKVLQLTRDHVVCADKGFSFDSVLNETTTQLELYELCVDNLILDIFQGFNGTVFAYGQTGSGKTHSVIGGLQEDEGIIPRALRRIFELIDDYKRNNGSVLGLRLSFLEIYNDEVRDLIHQDIKPREIAIREDKEGRIFFTGAREEAVTKVEDAFYFLDYGNRSRTTAETFMNASSSRSHAIFTVSLELLQRDVASAPDSYVHIQSKLHVVDLAGSERAKRTLATGQRLKESVGINQGLLALGRVIRALTTDGSSHGKASSQQHVPYRESKLTRFLQDALGGNSRTVMIACISPTEVNVHETLSTLQYASRARAVQNRAVANAQIVIAPEPEFPGSGSRSDDEVDDARRHKDESRELVELLRAQIQHMESEMQALVREREGASVLRLSGSGSLLRQSLQLHSHSAPPPQQQQFSETTGDALTPPVSPSLLSEQLSSALSNTMKILRDMEERLGRLQSSNNKDDSHISFVFDLCKKAIALMVPTCRGIDLSGGVADCDLSPSGAALIAGRTAGELQLDDEIQRLRLELAECREDLQRDEEIFAEKVKELKKARREVKQLQEQNAALLLSAANNKKPLPGPGATPSKAPDDAAAGKGSGHRKAAEINARRAADGEEKDYLDMERTLEKDYLDMSVAIVSTEPDISELMEDLETISREKDRLIAAKISAEEKCEHANVVAEQQIESFRARHRDLQEELETLEAVMKAKQDIIATLETSELQAKELASKAEKRANVLENETRRLKEQLESLQRATLPSRDEREEEKSKIVEYEAKLKLAQNMLDQQRRVAKEQLEKATLAAVQTKENVDKEELERLRSEYAALASQLDANDNRQRKTLESLTHQVAQYRKQSVESQSQIKDLEDKNEKLRVRLDRLSRSRRRSGETSPSVADDNSDRHGESSLKGHPRSKQTPHESDAIVNIDYVMKKLDNFAVVSAAIKQIELLQENRSSLVREKRDLETEMESLKAPQSEKGKKIAVQSDDVTRRLQNLVVELKKLKSLKDTLLRSGKSDEAVKELARVEAAIFQLSRDVKSNQERLDELQSRLTEVEGEVSPEVTARLADLQEDLETCLAELELNKLRTIEEANKVKSFERVSAKKGTSWKLADIDSGTMLEALNSSIKDFIDVSFSSPRSSESVLVQLTEQLIDLKCKSQALDTDLRQIKSQLESKDNEIENLQASLVKSRTAFRRKQDQARREAEDKVAFLLQQLKAAEGRGSTSSATSLPQSVASSILAPSVGVALGLLDNKHRRVSDVRLSQQGLGIADSPGSVHLLAEQQQEVTRRWLAEKERREQLERRNSEIVRELRALRLMANISGDGGGNARSSGEMYP